MIHKKLINNMLKETCIFDIETSSVDVMTGENINLRVDFDNYVANAVTKFIGIYSYKYKKYYSFNALTQKEEIIKLLSEHKTLVGFNSEAFDTPIIKNNKLLTNKWIKQVDMLLVLGNKQKYGHKNRAKYMGVDLKPVVIDGKEYGANTLMSMAYHFDLDILKGDIDYKIFNKDSWTDEETVEIKKYLKSDVMITKKLFEKAVIFWTIFTDWIIEADVKKWTWLRSSIASLTYFAACKVKGVEATFSNNMKEFEEMGGRAVIPTKEEVYGMHYLDEASKYPHTFAEFGLCSEVDVSTWTAEEIQKALDSGNLFHGNEKFKVKGYYDISEQGILEKDIIKKLKTRFAIKKILKTFKKTSKRNIETPEVLKDIIKNNSLTNETIKVLTGLQYAIKIFLNALYGIIRSNTFEKIHTPNAGWDCCYIGQQIHEYVEEFFVDKGFTIIGGFTDSWFFENREGYTKEDMIRLAKECMDGLKKYMPFPAETHIIDYERYVDYIVYHYDDKKKEYKKNNYAFISEGEVKIVGFPIKKNNATKLALHIFKTFLEPEGIKKNRLKFDKKYIDKLIKQELDKDISLAEITYKCNPAKTYKNPSQLQAQISNAYLDGLDGNISLIPNSKFGRVGKGNKYCTAEEVVSHNVEIKDLNLTKVYNELSPFTIPEKVVSLDDWGI